MMAESWRDMVDPNETGELTDSERWAMTSSFTETGFIRTTGPVADNVDPSAVAEETESGPDTIQLAATDWLLPIDASAAIDMRAPTRQNAATEHELDRVVASPIVAVLDTIAHASTDTESPILANARVERLLPSEAAPVRLSSDPNCTTLRADSTLPMRIIERSDRELPRSTFP